MTHVMKSFRAQSMLSTLNQNKPKKVRLSDEEIDKYTDIILSEQSFLRVLFRTADIIAGDMQNQLLKLKVDEDLSKKWMIGRMLTHLEAINNFTSDMYGDAIKRMHDFKTNDPILNENAYYIAQLMNCWSDMDMEEATDLMRYAKEHGRMRLNAETMERIRPNTLKDAKC